MLKIYNLLAYFVFTLYLTYHRWFTKKYGAAADEKYGYVPLLNSASPCLLIHAVSVGETLAAQTLIAAFTAKHPDWEIFLTVSTATARQVATEKYGAARVAYYPLDYAGWIERFLQSVRPQIVVLMELEVWPQFTRQCALHRIPLIVANARITEKSTAQYLKLKKYLPTLVKKMFNAPDYWLAQNEDYAARLREIGVTEDKIKLGGNLKFDQIPPTLSPEIIAAAQTYRELLNVGEGKLFVAGSTHPSEEVAVLTAWKNLRSDFPHLKLFIAPRHPHRINEVKMLAANFGKVILRSQITAPNFANNERNNEAMTAEIIIGDTLGELAKFYAAATVVFVGGTLIAHGGQNMGEPCGLGKPTIIGDSFYNFADMVAALRAAAAIKVINSPAELADAARVFLSDTAAAKNFGEAARAALLKHSGASEYTVKILQKLIDKRNCP